ADRLVGDDRQELAHVAAARGRPQIEKNFVLELAAEQRAEPRAGDAERMAVRGLEGEDEGVGEHAADRAGLDIGALGRRPPGAPLVPIVEHLAYRRMLHWGAPPASPAGRCPGPAQRGRLFETTGWDQQGAC